MTTGQSENKVLRRFQIKGTKMVAPTEISLEFYTEGLDLLDAYDRASMITVNLGHVEINTVALCEDEEETKITYEEDATNLYRPFSNAEEEHE